MPPDRGAASLGEWRPDTMFPEIRFVERAAGPGAQPQRISDRRRNLGDLIAPRLRLRKRSLDVPHDVRAHINRGQGPREVVALDLVAASRLDEIRLAVVLDS